MRWFDWLCRRDGKEAIPTFMEMVRKHFKGNIKPPFAEALRQKAGMGPEWYLPLAQDPSYSARQKTRQEKEE